MSTPPPPTSSPVDQLFFFFRDLCIDANLNQNSRRFSQSIRKQSRETFLPKEPRANRKHPYYPLLLLTKQNPSFHRSRTALLANDLALVMNHRFRSILIISLSHNHRPIVYGLSLVRNQLVAMHPTMAVGIPKAASLSVLESLPPEINLMIIESLADPSSIIKLALSGPVFYTIMTQFEPELAAKSFVTSIPRPLLQLADLEQFLIRRTVDYENTTEDAAKALITATSKAFGNTGHNWTSYRHMRSLRESQRSFRIYTTLLCTGRKLAQRALQRAPKSMTKNAAKKTAMKHLSANELDRFTKALYILEIISKGYPTRKSSRARDPNRVYDQAWLILWKEFAPWHMQHVRIVQNLLVAHTEEVVGNEYCQMFEQGVLDHELNGNLSRDSAAAFIIKEGPVSLHRLEERGSGTGATLVAAEMFLKSRERSMTRLDAYDTRHETLWVSQVENDRISLDMEPIFSRYKEDDMSAAAVWYNNLLYYHVDDNVTSASRNGLGACGI
ncbi:hypothetical protein GGR57DRAFT_511658 [Xylariaceae sp. FL1272]|nr:hypothetical protein GGR57DRAFT_511658 [Xylariaceae sp. FL1272]